MFHVSMFKKNIALYSAFPQVVTITVPWLKDKSMASIYHIIIRKIASILGVRSGINKFYLVCLCKFGLTNFVFIPRPSISHF